MPACILARIAVDELTEDQLSIAIVSSHLFDPRIHDPQLRRPWSQAQVALANEPAGVGLAQV